MFKKASKFERVQKVKLKENLDDALNNFDSANYQVDTDGQWEKATPISKFRKSLSDEELHYPAAVDSNHIVFFDKNNDAQVMNMIPEHHLDSLHDPKKESKWIKRAED